MEACEIEPPHLYTLVITMSRPKAARLTAPFSVSRQILGLASACDPGLNEAKMAFAMGFASTGRAKRMCQAAAHALMHRQTTTRSAVKVDAISLAEREFIRSKRTLASPCSPRMSTYSGQQEPKFVIAAGTSTAMAGSADDSLG